MPAGWLQFSKKHPGSLKQTDFDLLAVFNFVPAPQTLVTLRAETP
jgi:hypothetical protein